MTTAMSSDGPLEFRTVRTSLRPARVAVLAAAGEPAWDFTVMRIIECLSQCWGGRHSIVVPTDGRRIAPEIFRILELFDPDYIVDYKKTLRDVKVHAPSEYSARLDREYTAAAATLGHDLSDHEKRELELRLGREPMQALRLGPELARAIGLRCIDQSRQGNRPRDSAPPDK